MPFVVTTLSVVFFFQGSPGNLVQFEDVLFSSQDQVVGSAVIAVKLSRDEKSKVRDCKTEIILSFFLKT